MGEAGNADEARESARSTQIDVAIVDILMPSVSGISLTAELYEIQPTCKVLGLSAIDEPGLIADMLRRAPAATRSRRSRFRRSSTRS